MLLSNINLPCPLPTYHKVCLMYQPPGSSTLANTFERKISVFQFEITITTTAVNVASDVPSTGFRF